MNLSLSMVPLYVSNVVGGRERDSATYWRKVLLNGMKEVMYSSTRDCVAGVGYWFWPSRRDQIGAVWLLEGGRLGVPKSSCYLGGGLLGYVL